MMRLVEEDARPELSVPDLMLINKVAKVVRRLVPAIAHI